MKIQFLPMIFIICVLSLNACGKADDTAENVPGIGSESDTERESEAESTQTEPTQSNFGEEQALLAEDKLLEEQRESYANFIEKLDRMLSESRELSESCEPDENSGLSGNRELTENRGQESGGIYREEVSTVCMFSQSCHGVLRAEYGEEGTNAFQMVMRDGEKNEKHRYECRLLSDGSLWFSFRTESKSEKDLPDYVVNEDALRYSRADYVRDDGWTDIEAVKEYCRQEIEQHLEEDMDGEMQEFWYGGDFLYRIDREEKLFVDVMEDKESCIAVFLRGQIKRIDCRLPVSEASLDIVEKYKPAGYSLLDGKNGWDDIAVSDLNHDGRMDYIAALYPDDYGKGQRLMDEADPYGLSPEYCASEFWMLLSSEDGGYEQIRLSDSIEYWDRALFLTEVAFVDEGILQFEYFKERSPSPIDALLRFQYDEECKDFYILRSCYRSWYGDDLLLTGDTENYGETDMADYFSGRQNYCDDVWRSSEDMIMPDGTEVWHFNNRFQYYCENQLMEHRINSLVWEREYELVRALKEHYPDKDFRVSMGVQPYFYNERLVSVGVVLDDDSEEGIKIRTWMSVMVDRLSGEYVAMTELLEKEEFLQIFTDWSDDALRRGAITAEERSQCRETIEKCWENADTAEGCVGEQEESMSLRMGQKGVAMIVWSKCDSNQKYYMVEKEYFWGTKVWDYLGAQDDMREGKSERGDS